MESQVGQLLARTCPRLDSAGAAACDAAYPGAPFKGGVRRFPNPVPDNPDADPDHVFWQIATGRRRSRSPAR